MSVSLSATAISFYLYGACLFEGVQVLGPRLDENEGVKFDDSALSGPSVAPPYKRSRQLGAILFRGAFSSSSGFWRTADCSFFRSSFCFERDARNA